jgi:hypothetical protein
LKRKRRELLKFILSPRKLLRSLLLDERGENVKLDLDLVEFLGSQISLGENGFQPVKVSGTAGASFGENKAYRFSSLVTYSFDFPMIFSMTWM